MIKMKMADAQQVNAAVVEALRTDFMLDDLLRNQADEIWRVVSLTLHRLGCVMIQPDVRTDGSGI